LLVNPRTRTRTLDSTRHPKSAPAPCTPAAVADAELAVLETLIAAGPLGFAVLDRELHCIPFA
jgi:hypothetical protein